MKRWNCAGKLLFETNWETLIKNPPCQDQNLLSQFPASQNTSAVSVTGTLLLYTQGINLVTCDF